MMLSPYAYANGWKDADYTELIRERDALIRSIRRFERKEKEGDRTGSGWSILPAPETVYQMELEYLSELCRIMHDRYSDEYAWGERTLHDDAER